MPKFKDQKSQSNKAQAEPPAGAAPAVAVVTIKLGKESQSECAVCTDAFHHELADKVPRLLLCGHSYCTACCTKLITTNAIVCPLDRQVTAVKDGKADNLGVNFALKDLIEILASGAKSTGANSDSKSGAAGPTCDACDPIDQKSTSGGAAAATAKADNTADVHCTKCESDLCKKCDARMHVNKLATHKRVPIANKAQVAVIKCDKHHETIHHYCITCSEAICLVCKDDGHVSHDIKFAAAVVEQMRTAITV